MTSAEIQLVIFDLDGTLIDTPQLIVETFSAVFAALSAPAREVAAIRATIGMPLELAFGSLLGTALDDPQVVLGIEHYQRLFKELVLPNAANRVFPGVVDGLAELAKQGVALAVATSKFRRSADALLTAAGLGDHFDLVVGADEVSHPKPHPEIGQTILRVLGMAAEHAVVVGDTTHDLLMARVAKMRSIGVTYGIHDRATLATADPTWLADSFPEVVERVRATAQEGAAR
jgi:phosphoglycolate phosphatase